MGEPESPRAVAFAVAWMTHPMTVVALVVMVINDHVLKAAFGTWWTGKLSDVAGLVFFPALVAVAVAIAAPRMPVQVIKRSALAATAAVFLVVKGTAWGAAAASGILSSMLVPSLVRQDATDLLALFALGLAAWTAHSSLVRPTHLHARLKRAFAVAVVPAAVLATAATSTQGNQIASGFGVAGDDVYLATSYDEWCTETEEDPGCTQWYRLAEDEWWVSGAPIPPGLDDADDCAPRDPATCYRPGQGISVQATQDGGRTWTTEWSLSESEVETLAENAGADVALANTMQIAVVPRGDGYQVWAANGVDGLAVRHIDGTWERLGWTTVGDPSYAPTAPPSLEPETPGELAHAPLMFAWSGILIPACAWLVLERGRRRRPAIWRAVLGTSAGFVFFVGFTIGLARAGFESLTSFFLGGPFPYVFGLFVYTLVGIIATGAAVAVGGMAGSLVSRTWGATGIYFGTTAGGIVVIALVVPNQPVAQFAASSLAIVGGAVYWYWKGPRTHEEPPVTVPQFPIDAGGESHVGELTAPHTDPGGN